MCFTGMVFRNTQSSWTTHWHECTSYFIIPSVTFWRFDPTVGEPILLLIAEDGPSPEPFPEEDGASPEPSPEEDGASAVVVGQHLDPLLLLIGFVVV